MYGAERGFQHQESITPGQEVRGAIAALEFVAQEVSAGANPSEKALGQPNWKKAIERGGREFGNTFGKMKTSQGLFPILDAIRRSNLSLLQRAIFEKFRESIFNTERK